jgi:hypothetical protein
MQESRRSRLRQGALSWELRRDIANPARYLEHVTDESWTEHLRRFDRVTAADVALRERKLAFHVADDPPLVTRWVVDPSSRPEQQRASAYRLGRSRPTAGGPAPRLESAHPQRGAAHVQIRNSLPDRPGACWWCWTCCGCA